MRGMVYAASPLTRVIIPARRDSTGWSAPISGSAARTSQLSITVVPVLSPPCTVRPLRGRAVTLTMHAVVTLVLLAEVAGGGDVVVGLTESAA